MADEPDYYAILEVAADADEQTIRLAYRRLARRYHPDVAGTGSLARMQALNVAYAVLSDPEQRRRYDARHGRTSTSATSATAAASSAAHASHTARPVAPRHGTLRHADGPLRCLTALAASDATPVSSLAFARGGALVGLGLIDGRVQLHDVPSGNMIQTLAFGSQPVAGVLQELRLSPSGTHAAAWGFLLGTRIWRAADGAQLWHVATNGPSGMMDAALVDEPPFLRLAVPDAPLALADDDPFRFADEGKRGTAVYSRPLGGVVDPAWAVPLRCDERRGGGLFREPADERWRVRHRALSSDGRRLLTLATGGLVQGRPGVALTLWDANARSRQGVPEARRTARIAEPEGSLEFPVAATPDLVWVAASDFPVGLRLLAFGGQRLAIEAGPVRADARLALAPDAALLALARDARLELWETRAARRVQEWQLAAEITALAFALADRPLLGIGLANGVAELWG
jgi:hypothetical protein